ncbi:MAG: copper amine oxidase N-terminal domain-containing protein [Capsulimonas sp.]|uniref:copper amine oxidase N-terminal domain-containing protein n=1 Tax=Capsulimonas sp. TaxID=2494211 RepID=UPI0032663061
MKTKLWIAAAGLLATAAHADTTTVVTQKTTSTPAVTVTVNQQRVAFAGAGPIIAEGGSVFVPLRGVFEQLGGQIQWEPASQVVTGARPGHQFRIRIGSDQALVDGTQRTLTVAPRVIGKTTYVPLRFASEALGATVDWQPSTHTVLITSAPTEAVVKKTTTTTTTTTIKKH